VKNKMCKIVNRKIASFDCVWETQSKCTLLREILHTCLFHVDLVVVIKGDGEGEGVKL